MKRIVQPNNYTCALAVAAMATGTTIEDVVAFLGKDGGHEDFEQAGVLTEEVTPYLEHHGLLVGQAVQFNMFGKATWWDGGVPGALLETLSDVSVGEHRFWLSDPALVTVRSRRFEGKLHQVLWTGQHILDPAPNAADSEPLSAYHISEWVPVWRKP